MLPLLAAGISAGTSLLGAKMASDATKEANQRAQAAQDQANRTAIALRDQDHERQERFARSGIQWRVEDAKAAGIHPLYALGASTSTYSPSPTSIGTAPIAADTSMGTAVSSMGQDISRALNSTRSQTQRDDAFTKTVQEMSLQKMGLENELLASQIQRLKVQSNPPMPGLVGRAPGDLQVAGMPIKKDPSTSDMQDFSDRYGDEGLAQWTIPPMIMWRDYQATTGGRGPDTSSWPSRVGSAVWEGLKWADRNIKVFPQRREWTNPR